MVAAAGALAPVPRLTISPRINKAAAGATCMFFLVLRYVGRAFAFRSVKAGFFAFCLGVALWILGRTTLTAVCLVFCALSFFFRLFVLQARLDEADKLLQQLEKSAWRSTSPSRVSQLAHGETLPQTRGDISSAPLGATPENLNAEK